MTAKKKSTKPDDYTFRENIDPEIITPLLEKESDRGVILILAAYLEEILGGIISDACVTNSLADGIINHRMPAGDFQSRLLIAQALGLIDETEVQALQIIQRIRNKSAHFDRKGSGFDVLFDSSSTMSQVVNLTQLFDLPTPPRQQPLIRLCFIAATKHLASCLAIRRAYVKRPSLLKSTKEVAEGMLSEYEGTLIGERIKALKKDNSPPMFHIYVHYLNLIMMKAEDYSASHNKPVSPEEILRVFDKQLAS